MCHVRSLILVFKINAATVHVLCHVSYFVPVPRHVFGTCHVMSLSYSVRVSRDVSYISFQNRCRDSARATVPRHVFFSSI
jgi:hypothetical protein